MELDEKDKAILEILKRDSRKSFIDIGNMLNMSEAAVRRRVKNLVDRGVIKAFTIEIEKGYHVKALTFLSIDPNTPSNEVISKLIKVRGIETIYEVTGEYDAVAMIEVPDMHDLNRCIEEIRNIQGIKETNTAIILRQTKASGYV
ncbi:MAG TPA: Lrp/AsnC family transcriptional regulator [Candidatus Caldiarchaeum subterraneum]|uniref:Lrp/AsnC family transcriptional regulator n=1 Tax=Caldiarchaeum subterraneum TaxID=311458 RepID=A0A832ZUZ4_CALS0|nr:Lrp/AsnC family transcriptional regulator [Candidatus Caldarchaeum subterraneum]